MIRFRYFALIAIVTAVAAYGWFGQDSADAVTLRPAACVASPCPSVLHPNQWVSLGACDGDAGRGPERCELYQNLATFQLCRQDCVYY